MDPSPAPPSSNGGAMKPHWLNRNVIGMSLASFLSDLGHEAATSLLPAFLATLGAPPWVLGLLEGLADGVSSGVKVLSGFFSDRLGVRKPIAVAGYFLTGISVASFALASVWPQVLIARVIGWFGRGSRGPVRDAMLSRSVPPEASGRAFGLHRAADTIGATLGPLAALALLQVWTERRIFAATLIPGLLSGIAFWALVKGPPRAALKHLEFAKSLRALPRGFRFFLLATLIFGLGDFARTLLILRATEVLTPTYGPHHAGELAMGLYVFHNFIYALGAFPVGRLGDALGKKAVLAGTYALLGIASTALAVETGHSVPVLAVIFAFAGLSLSGEEALRGALAADLLPDEIRATGYGTLAAASGIGDFGSSVTVGLLWTVVSPGAAFGSSAVLAFAGAVLLLRIRLQPRAEARATP